MNFFLSSKYLDPNKESFLLLFFTIRINIHYKLNELNLIVWTFSMKEEMRQSNELVSDYRFLKEFTFYMTYDRLSNIALFSSTGSIKNEPETL